MEVTISLNEKYCNTNIVLNKLDCLPHISLLMGCLHSDHLDHAKKLLREISYDHTPLELLVSDIVTVTTPPGDVMSLDIRRDKSLEDLQESVYDAFTPLLTHDAQPADMFDPELVSSSSLSWINNYVSESCFENFWPHITVGYVKENATADGIEPFLFSGSRLAICHLGNYCTCKRILFETSLENS
jgi:hypothetical protein